MTDRLQSNSYKINNLRILGIIYIVLFSIAFLQRLGNKEINYFIRYIIAAFWILLSFIQLIKNNGRVIKYKQEMAFFLKMFIRPYVAIGIYNLFLFVFGFANHEFAGRCISNIVTMFITILVSFSTIYLLKDKTLKYTIISIAISFLIVILYNLVTLGPSVFTNVFYTFINNTDTVNVFEVHDLTFAMGLILIAYVYFRKKITVNDLITCTLALFIMMIGFKRIQLLAIALIVMYMTIVRRLKERFRNKLMIITCYAIIISCYLYIFIIKNGYFDNLINSLGINTMGRIYFYDWISNFFEFSPKFLGLGLGATSKMMELDTQWSISAIHSDILRMYVELGFVGYAVWALYYLKYCYKSILNKYAFIDAELYFILTLYLFILYFTDNTYNYFATQYIYMVLITMFTIKDTARLNNGFKVSRNYNLNKIKKFTAGI